VQVLGNVQECAACVRVRARAGLGVGSYDTVKRNRRENVRGARRGALRGGAEGAEEHGDDEGVYLHDFFFQEQQDDYRIANYVFFKPGRL